MLLFWFPSTWRYLPSCFFLFFFIILIIHTFFKFNSVHLWRSLCYAPIAVISSIFYTWKWQVIPGSHKLGRIEHVMVGGQTGADLERVEFARKRLGHAYVELEAGDAIFFHCNLLHCSSPNNSDRRRWSFILSYNRKDNDPVIPHHHPQYTPMTMVWMKRIMRWHG